MSMNTPYGSLISTKNLKEFQELNELGSEQYMVAIADDTTGTGGKIKATKLSSSMISSDADNQLIIGSDNKLYAKMSSITDVIDAQNMYETGKVLRDERGLEQLKEMKISSFGLSKFTVVGSPSITDDGIVSGFSNTNYIQIKNIIFGSANWKIRVKYKTDNNTTRTGRLVFTSFDGIYYYNNKLYFGVRNSSGNLIVNDNFIPTINTEYLLELEYKNGVYVGRYSIDNGTTWNIVANVPSSDIAKGTTTEQVINIGSNNLVGSIDLKQFSITVDDIEVFNGNKTGVDQIKKDDYTAVGNPTISVDGIASGFSNVNYLKVLSTPIDLSKNVTFEFKLKGLITDNVRVFLGSNSSFRFGIRTSDGNIHTISSNNAQYAGTLISGGSFSGIITSSEEWYKVIIALKENTIEHSLIYKGTKYTRLYTLNANAERGIVSELRIGYNSNNSYVFNGSIDLNEFKIYVDDKLVYQPILHIPYTQSKTGSKIVDAIYRDRVQDMYEQFGYADYYTLGGEKYNVQVVGNPTLVGGIASGFSGANYLTKSNLSLSNDIIFKFRILETISTSFSYLFSSNNSTTFYDGIKLFREGTTLKLITTTSSTTNQTDTIFTDLKLNEYYDLEIGIKNNKITIKVNNSITKEITLASNVYWNDINNSSLLIGSRRVQAGTVETVGFWHGSIDLSQFSIEVDGKEVFRGYEKGNLTLPMGEIYGMIETVKQNGGYHPNIFEMKWTDHLLNDMSWLRADTFSWQDGNVYKTAYDTLVSEYATGTTETEGSITFKRTSNGYKIANSNMESAILSKYNTDGRAWYYILDTTNKKFKLPRTKFGFEGIRSSVGDDIAESLPNITGVARMANNTGLVWSESDNTTGAFTRDNSGSAGYPSTLSGSQPNFQGLKFDASLSSSTYQNEAPVQERATQMYLYFYVGEYSRSAIQQTAGLNAEMFNGKQDVCTHIIKTFVDGSSGYRIWSDSFSVQWGAIPNVSGNSWQTVNFLKKFRDTHYIITTQLGYDSLVDLEPVLYNINTKTVSSMQINSNNLPSRTIHWTVSGYLEEGEY